MNPLVGFYVVAGVAVAILGPLIAVVVGDHSLGLTTQLLALAMFGVAALAWFEEPELDL